MFVGVPFGLLKPIKDIGKGLFRNANSSVNNRNADKTLLHCSLKGYTAGWSKFDRVGHEIENDLPYADGIGPNTRKAVWKTWTGLEGFILNQSNRSCHDAPEHVREINDRTMQLQLAC